MIEIKEVKTKKDLKKFISYPKQLYKDCPYYVPSLESDDLNTLTSHPAKEFCDIKLWLAFKDGKIAGRIAGIINNKYNELKNSKRIRFGWFDVENDVSTAEMLLKKVENWGLEKGLNQISGPSRFSNMEKQGMLIEGFNKTPTISAEYNYSYYPEFLDQLGFEKEVDYVQYLLQVTEIPEKIKRISESVLKRYNIKVKEFKDKKELLDYAKDFFLTLNESFEGIYNFLPLTDAEIDYMIKNNFTMADKDLICVLTDENDKIIGFGFNITSLNKAFQKAKGKLFPFGWYHIKKALKKNDSVDLYLNGVVPEWLNKGLSAAYHYQQHKIFLEKGFKYAVTTQQLEDNIASRIWEKYDSEVFMRRRCYVKNLE